MEMASIIFERVRKFLVELVDSDVQCDGGRNNEGVERVYDNQSELNNVVLQPEKKRRKVLKSLCFKQENVNRISGWLGKNDINTIGIYGMGGVGKTTLAKQLRTRILNCETPFNGIHAVGWVSVGVNSNIYQLQEEIAGVFGLDLHGDKDVTRRAAMINAYLSCNNNKCVLFLDDLWVEFWREDVGIPKKCKLILISRSLDVCRVLQCQKVLKVEPLSEDESWELFNDSIGYVVLDSEQVPGIRKCVYNKCAGLPLAVTGLANSLRKMVDDHASSWSEVLESTDFLSLGGTHLEDAISKLKLSFERLKDPKLQHCFLYSALYPKDCAISREKLICLWIGVGLIADLESLQAQYDMGHTILNKLLNSCLLETCQDGRSVKMHDLVRHMALAIAADKHMVQAGEPSKMELCENLHVLFPYNTPKMIPESCFTHMRSLRVLNLSDTSIIMLPISIGSLEELRVLDLSYCRNLKQVLYLAKLLKLQFLDLSQTSIEKVPLSLEKLKKLKELNLSSIPENTKIPSEVLLGLFRLKRLACHVVGTINELLKMNSLEILEARFFNLCDFNTYVRSQHWCILESYHLQVGGEMGPTQPYSRRVSLHGCSLTSQGDYIVVPSNVHELYVDNCAGFRSLSDVIYPVAYHNRKDCQNCTSVGSCNEEQNQQAEVLASLEICTIRRCCDVETLFAMSWMENLQFLESLQVEDCGQLKEVIREEGNCDVIRLPWLRRLALTLLPQMSSIYTGRLVCASLVSCTFVDCPNLKRLPFFCKDNGEESFPSRLEWIEGQEKWWEVLKWDQPETKALLEPLFRFRSLDDDNN